MGLLRRTLDPAFLTEVVNHDCVRPHLMGEGPIVLDGIVGNPENITLQSDGGGYIFINLGSGAYELHSQFLPEYRGPHQNECAREAATFMFTRTDCITIETMVPRRNVVAKAGALRAGFSVVLERPDRFCLSLPHEAWRQNEAALVEWGQRFHRELTALKEARGSELHQHDDDPDHDAAVGAACLTCLGGHPGKAVWLYNGWARKTGYALVNLVSESPVVVDFGDAVAQATADGWEFLICR